jgi:hypothetical protein
VRIAGICLSWKVLAGLAVVALGVFLFEPQLFARAFPLLLVAACPLSMVLMMWGMRGAVSPSTREQGSVPERSPSTEVLTKGQALSQLRQQLDDIQGQQAQLIAQLSSIETSTRSAGPSDGRTTAASRAIHA